MRIQDFNATAVAPPDELQTTANVIPAADRAPPENAGQAEIEIAMLKAQIEHLELVVETARNLMSSNQERLLRRLHDLPREMMALGARLHRTNSEPTIRRVA